MKKQQHSIQNTWKRENRELLLLLIPLSIMIIIFCYLPMWGLVIAFQDYKAGNSFFSLTNTTWVGLKHIKRFVNSMFFGRVVRNTIRLSLLHLLFGFTIPILFALLLNEVRNTYYKRFVQTVSYMPHFISTVVVAGMMISFLDVNGMVNTVRALFGLPSKSYITDPKAYPAIYTILTTWKGFGFSSILYFSTISSIDPTLYESARMDGANRWQQMLHITLPSIMYIIAIRLILQVGNILDSNTGLGLLLYRPATYSTSDTIGTYIHREGVVSGKFSYTTAVGLFMSIIDFALTFITNKISNRLTGHGLW